MSRGRARRRQRGVSGEGLGLGGPPAVTRAPRPPQRLCDGRAGPSDAARSPPPAGSLGEQPPAAPRPLRAAEPGLCAAPAPGTGRPGPGRPARWGGGWQRPLVLSAARDGRGGVWRWPGVVGEGGRQNDVPRTGVRGRAAPAWGGGPLCFSRPPPQALRHLCQSRPFPQELLGAGCRCTGLWAHRDAGPGWAGRCSRVQGSERLGRFRMAD